MRIRNILFILLMLFLYSGCSMWEKDQTDKKPQPLIPREKMISILADIQIVEAYLNDLRKSGHQVKDSTVLYYEKIFKKNGITRSNFNANLLYYKKDLANLGNIYTEVITRLNELKAKNEEMLLQMKADSMYQDSLIKVKLREDSLFQIRQADSIKKAKLVSDSIDK